MTNEFKNNPKEETTQSQDVKRKVTAGRLFDKLSKIAIIPKEKVIEQMPFIFFLTFLGLVYISNTYSAEKNIREIDKITSELKELRSEYISTKSEFMFKSKQSEVAKAMAASGIKESIVPPKKIIVRNN